MSSSRPQTFISTAALRTPRPPRPPATPMRWRAAARPRRWSQAEKHRVREGTRQRAGRRGRKRETPTVGQWRHQQRERLAASPAADRAREITSPPAARQIVARGGAPTARTARGGADPCSTLSLCNACVACVARCACRMSFVVHIRVCVCLCVYSALCLDLRSLLNVCLGRRCLELASATGHFAMLSAYCHNCEYDDDAILIQSLCHNA